MIKSLQKSHFSSLLLNDSIFRMAYFINLFLCSIVILDVVSVFINAVIFVWSLFIFNDKIKRKVLNIKYSYLIMLFIFFWLVTDFLHITVGFPFNFLANVGMTYHGAVCFFMFYGMYKDNKPEEIKKEAILLFKIIVFLTTLFNILSFIMLLFIDSFEFGGNIPSIEKYVEIIKNMGWDMPTIEKYEHTIGIIKDIDSMRFTGIYTNPNIVAFCSAVAIIFCHILYQSSEFLKNEKSYIKVIFFVLTISVNLAALILSDSIASFLFLVIYSVLWIFYKLLLESNSFSIKSVLKKSLAFLLVCIALIFSLFGIRSCFQDSASNVMDEIYSIISSVDIKKEADESIHFGRPNHDIRSGSGRRRLLNQAAVLVAKHPLLGIGNANIVDYGKIYFKSGIAFPNIHNGYVSVLVSNGIIGFIIFILFLVLVLTKLFLFLLKKCPTLKGNVFSNLFIAILSYLIFALFEKTMLSEVNFMGLFFWLILGYAVTYIYSYDEFDFKERYKIKDTFKK